MNEVRSPTGCWLGRADSRGESTVQGMYNELIGNSTKVLIGRISADHDLETVRTVSARQAALARVRLCMHQCGRRSCCDLKRIWEQSRAVPAGAAHHDGRDAIRGSVTKERKLPAGAPVLVTAART